MKKLILSTCLVLILVIELYSQEYCQQSYLEMNECYDNDKTYVCQASNSIQLLPGFQYAPASGNDMCLDIDRYSVFPPAEDSYGYGSYGFDDVGGAVVGSLPAIFNVDNTGAAVYSIDIKLPAAIGTMAPRLSIGYNNQSGNGLMGWSWDVGGLSTISRVGQTEYHDYKITNVDFENDRFAIDGNRLFVLDDAEYGTNGAVYKTELDNMDKIVSYTKGYKGPEYFVIWKSDGTIWEYGATTDSRIEPANRDKVVFKWLLNRISDRDGNAVLFHYDINNVTGESYINNIEYTVNEKHGVKAMYNVIFQYDMERVDKWGGYVAGTPVLCSRLLKNIQVVKNDTRKLLFDYSFEYYEPAYYGNRYFLHYRLKSIGLRVGDKKINPTKIVWNDEKKHFPESQGYQLYELDKTAFTEIPFIGDFNGDGLSDVLTVPYKIQDTYPIPIKAKVYLNDRKGSFEKEAMTNLLLPKNLDWIYVVDLDNDSKDDIITYECSYDKEPNDEKVMLNIYLLQDGTFVKKASYSYVDNVTIIPGNFIMSDKKGLIVFTSGNAGKKNKTAEYIAYSNGNFVKKIINNIEPLHELEVNHMAIDMTGDGVAELISMEENGCYINSLIYDMYNDTYSMKYYSHCLSLKKDVYPFPNDFNGDGKTDVLYYDPKTYWNMLVSKGDGFLPPVPCNNTNLLRYVTLNPKDRYRCSLKEMMEPTVSIRTADFDGDGISDVAVFKNTGGNYYLQVGFLPYMRNDGAYDFSYTSRFNMPINYSHQTIHIGRFLPQENVSFISSLSKKPYASEKPYVVAFCPHSAMYSVERITDGLGNTRGFCYDYLMNKDNSGFYTSDNDRLGFSMKKTNMPVRALKADTIFSSNEKPIVTTYQYSNAVVHTKGHGFLGFETIVVRTIVNNECVQKKEQKTEFKTMGKYCILLPSSVKSFHGEKQLVKKITPKYVKYICNRNEKVFMPLLVANEEIEYDYDKQGQILKKTIMNYTYSSDNHSENSYDDLVRLVKTTTGCTDDKSVADVYDCDYWEETETEFDDVLDEWVINRPVLRKNVYGGGDDHKIGGVETILYDDNNKLKIASNAKIPNLNGDRTDSLMMSFNYEYDKFGHLVRQIISSPSLRHKKIIQYEYGEKYQYRYMTKTVDELGNEIRCDYDSDFGILTQTVDYNQFVTENIKDPLGVDDELLLSDGMQQHRSLRWSSGHEYAPYNASYYCWKKCTGKSEVLTFYHKNGSELRKVTFDIKGNAVFQDKSYDDFGNVVKETLPYYDNDEKMLISNKYDKYNRLVETKYPNELMCSIDYDGCKMTSNMVLKYGAERTKIDEFNVKGWLVNTTDIGGNRISYEYYNDGLMKSAMINGDEKTKITIEYDNNRNRSRMSDPNYGVVRYTNDALGNIVKVMTHNGNVTEFEYDRSGRKICRKEIDGKNNEEIVTHWVYDDQRGKKGMLKKVCNDNHSIEYFYDDKLRLVNAMEIIDDVEYITSYTYDKANRISSITYPTGFAVIKTYSNSGYEQANYDKEDEALLWKTLKTNAVGHITEYELGNGVRTAVSYDPATSSVDNIYTSKNDKVIQNIMYEYDELGNIVGRSENMGKTIKKETFEYDQYDRLTKAYLNGKLMQEMVYDNKGNIIEKNIEDVRVLYDVVYSDKKPYNILEAKTEDAGLYFGQKQKVDYSVSDNVVKVMCDDKEFDIVYGSEQTRISMNVYDGKDVFSKVYVANNEYIITDDDKIKRTYLMGPMGVYGVCTINEDDDKSMAYIHKDNIDSWCVITDEDGDVLQRLSFDAWGNIRNAEDWCSEPLSEKIMFDRGYTGHEHLSDFGLINMNGRMYDPMMSIMISPDNNIQMPQMSQNFNRYSYCLNNPLKYNDPTGEWVESVLLGVAFGASNVVFNADKIDSFSEGLLLFGAGFAQGFLMEYTMGQSWLVQVATNTLTGTFKSGVNEIVSVGDGHFDFSGNDWNAVAKSTYYGLGSNLVKSILNSYVNCPTEDYAGDKLQYLFFGNEEVGYAMTSLMAHGMGCWFSGQPMLSTMKFKDMGFDLGMLNIIATRLLRSYIYRSDFAGEVMERHSQDIKEKMLNDILSEDPDYGDFEMINELSYVDVSAGRIYVSANIFALLPGEMLKEYPKPYLDEVVSFPFSYSLFKTLFFNK